MAILFIDKDFESRQPDGSYIWRHPDPNESFDCTNQDPGATNKHQKFYAIQRRPADQVGHFMVFRINGKEHVIDASVPTHVDRLPRDAVEIPPELAEKILHHRCGSHLWGCCFLAEVKALCNPNPGGHRHFQRYGW